MDYTGTNTSYIDKRSASMAIASMVIGIAGMPLFLVLWRCSLLYCPEVEK